MSRTAILLALALVGQLLVVGCIGTEDPATDDVGTASTPTDENASEEIDPRLPHTNETGPPPPAGENYTGLEPIDMIFDGSLRTEHTRVLLVPPTHGDLGTPTNTSRSGLAYLEATLTGIFAWEPAIDRFIETYPSYSYLDNITVQVDAFDEAAPQAAGYDIVIGYAETSGGEFRGVAIKGPGNENQEIQRQLNEAGLGEMIHAGHRYILLSLFANAPRAGQDTPDYPETHEVRGVTMHEFAHVWGLGHSSAWTRAYGPDLMNSPYPFVYGDGDPAGDGGERSTPLCITSLNLHGLGHLYRWLPNGTWEASHENVSLPMDMDYTRYCEVFEEANARAEAWLAERGLLTSEDLQAVLALGPR